MRSVQAFFVSIVAVLIVLALTSPAHAGVSFSLFYSNLSPHGSWLVSAEYGRVWQPYEYDRGWNPYVDGHWVYADVGWTWVSDYGWGDVPYHYGTWFDDPRLGWVWIPGYTWAPAWVVFRTGPDYIGWAPVSPGFTVGGSLGYGVPASPFVFVSANHFCDPHVHRYIVPQREVRTFYGETKVVNNLVVERNVVVNRGPDPRFIERASGRKIHQVPIESVPRVIPGGGPTRSVIAIDGRGHEALRVARPVPAREALPQGRQQDNHQHGTEPRAQAPPRGDSHATAPTSSPAPAPSAGGPPHQPSGHHQAPAASAQPSPTKPTPRPNGHGKPQQPGKPQGSGKPHDSGKPHGQR